MEAFGREMTEGRRRGSGLGGGGSGLLGRWFEWAKEMDEECAEERLRDSFFIFLERDLEGGGNMKESESEVAEERDEFGAEESGGAMEISDTWAGVCMRNAEGGPFLRGK